MARSYERVPKTDVVTQMVACVCDRCGCSMLYADSRATVKACVGRLYADVDERDRYTVDCCASCWTALKAALEAAGFNVAVSHDL